MKKISKKMLAEFISSIAIVMPSDIPDDDGMVYLSKKDGSYMGRVGMEDQFKHFLKRGITEQFHSPKHKVACVGFNPTANKWYGWSHRAIYGFTEGSTCKRGDCHYVPFDKDDFLDDTVMFWNDKHHVETSGKHATQDGVDGVLVTYKYDNKVPNEKIRGTISSVFNEYPDEYGKGEWTAKTMDDAYEMACDFAEGVG